MYLHDNDCPAFQRSSVEKRITNESGEPGDDRTTDRLPICLEQEGSGWRLRFVASLLIRPARHPGRRCGDGFRAKR
jgi:hypothetical protein